MSACSNFTLPGPAQAYLLILITLLFYLEMRKMPLECYMQARSPRQKRLDYNPTFLLVPDQYFCKDQYYSLVYQRRTENFEGRALFRRVFRNYSSQYNFTIIFPLGLSSNVTVNEALFEEHTGFDDILQADLDTYQNLTLKFLSLEVYVRRCSHSAEKDTARADGEAYDIFRDLLRNHSDNYDDERKANYLAVQAQLGALGVKQQIDDDNETYEQFYNTACQLIEAEKYEAALADLDKAIAEMRDEGRVQ